MYKILYAFDCYLNIFANEILKISKRRGFFSSDKESDDRKASDNLLMNTN